jgi:hypothetical protein
MDKALICEFCGKTNNPPRPYYMMNEREELLRQTPRYVWEEYRADGYTLAQAISMEFSYV